MAFMHTVCKHTCWRRGCVCFICGACMGWTLSVRHMFVCSLAMSCGGCVLPMLLLDRSRQSAFASPRFDLKSAVRVWLVVNVDGTVRAQSYGDVNAFCSAVHAFYYAMKANATPDILQALAAEGFGMECVSVAEVRLPPRL